MASASSKTFDNPHWVAQPSSHSHRTISLLATAMTIYHYLGSKVTPLQLPQLLPHALPSSFAFSLIAALFALLSLHLPCFFIQLGHADWERNKQANSLRYTWKTCTHFHMHAPRIY